MGRTRQKVTLTLDPEIYRRFRAVSERIPGKVNLSAMMDRHLESMVVALEPLLDQLEAEPDRGKQAAIIRALFGGMVLEAVGNLDARTRALGEATER